MSLSKLGVVAGGCLLAVPTGLVLGGAAWADPAGCSAANGGITTLSNGELYTFGDGSCDTSAYRNLQVEIKHDITGRPDPAVDHSNDIGSYTYYATSVASCDNGWRTAKYYGRTFFRTNTTYHDSTHRSLLVC